MPSFMPDRIWYFGERPSSMLDAEATPITRNREARQNVMENMLIFKHCGEVGRVFRGMFGLQIAQIMRWKDCNPLHSNPRIENHSFQTTRCGSTRPLDWNGNIVLCSNHSILAVSFRSMRPLDWNEWHAWCSHHCFRVASNCLQSWCGNNLTCLIAWQDCFVNFSTSVEVRKIIRTSIVSDEWLLNGCSSNFCPFHGEPLNYCYFQAVQTAMKWSSRGSASWAVSRSSGSFFFSDFQSS